MFLDWLGKSIWICLLNPSKLCITQLAIRLQVFWQRLTWVNSVEIEHCLCSEDFCSHACIWCSRNWSSRFTKDLRKRCKCNFSAHFSHLQSVSSRSYYWQSNVSIGFAGTDTTGILYSMPFVVHWNLLWLSCGWITSELPRGISLKTRCPTNRLGNFYNALHKCYSPVSSRNKLEV